VIASHVVAAMRWASKQSGAPGSRLVVRSVSTRFKRRFQACGLRNSYLAFANGLTRSMSPRYGASFFDSWPMEAPRFKETCGNFDHHYSCVNFRHGGGGRVMVGEVGEAVAKSLLHFLLYTMP